MTGLLSESLNYCYSLMFSANAYAEKGCYIKALLCYENCRIEAQKGLGESIYSHCLLRAARKEAQILMKLDLSKRALNMLSSTLSKVERDFHSMDKLLILAQLVDLCEMYPNNKQDTYSKLLNEEVAECSNI